MKYNLIEKIYYYITILLVVEVPPWVSLLFGTRKKAIWHLGLSRSLGNNFLGPLKVNMNIVYFHMNVFHFTKKFLPPLTMQGFFSKYFIGPYPLRPK